MKRLVRLALLLTLMGSAVYWRGTVTAAATPTTTPSLYLPLAFTTGEAPASAPLYIATMTHMEGNF